MNNKIRTEAVKHLFEAILTLQDEEECFQFFEDLCTVNELLSLSQRFEVASMLKRKDTYLKIAEKTGASTATISRVNRSLSYGNDSYDMDFLMTWPAVSKYTIAVSALTEGTGSNPVFDSSYSSYGAGVDFSAPGTKINVANYKSTTGTVMYGSDGTSYAAPHITAAAADLTRCSYSQYPRPSYGRIPIQESPL